jgi:hypothetical protein
MSLAGLKKPRIHCTPEFTSGEISPKMTRLSQIRWLRHWIRVQRRKKPTNQIRSQR